MAEINAEIKMELAWVPRPSGFRGREPIQRVGLWFLNSRSETRQQIHLVAAHWYFRKQEFEKSWLQAENNRNRGKQMVMGGPENIQ